ncbi:hypothetical protein [Methylobacterium sp. OT2]|uniref:hypothetical protein n=1 Tax=Methylobacterium sp. OT2 TaxID=2813779 RepID=UPI00197C41A9|nr:hypothetical protein [Methylobacterium sp. OT2]MBN4096073.1 hypothetical protein [Methylobacterium sp. OT2]
MLAVVLGVVLARLRAVVRGVLGMPVGAVRVVGGLLVMTALVVFGGLAVMLRGVLVVLGSLMVVVSSLMLVGHGGVLRLFFPALWPEDASRAVRNNQGVDIAERRTSRLREREDE